MVIGTAYDITHRKDTDSEDPYISGVEAKENEGFELQEPKTVERILSVDVAPDTVRCLHGIRVLSIGWLILGYTLYFMSVYFENSLGAAEALEEVAGQVVIHSTLAVDTFFVVRLTPAYAITIMALTCLLPYMSDGPNWTRDSRAYYSNCNKYCAVSKSVYQRIIGGVLIGGLVFLQIFLTIYFEEDVNGDFLRSVAYTNP
nr:hypothetical protein BaRGS_033332 [Batillaria attramentaria]